MTISRDSGCALLSSSDQSEALPKAPQRTNGCPDLPEAANAPKRTCSEDSNDSAKSKESQATTGMWLDFDLFFELGIFKNLFLKFCGSDKI